MRRIGSKDLKTRAVWYVRDCLAVLEAAEILILRLLLFSTLVYHFVHSMLTTR